MDVLIHRPWSTVSMPIMNGILSGTVQLFFGWRIWIFAEKSRLGTMLAAVIVATALAQSIAGVVSGLRFTIANDSAFLAEVFTGCVVWIGGALLCDLIITLSMFYLLFSARAKTNFNRTNTLLTRLIFLSVQTGLLTSVVAAIELVLLVAWRDYEFHEIPGFVLAKMYSNALLANLNARATHRRSRTIDIFSVGTLRTFPDFQGTAVSTLRFNNHSVPDMDLRSIDIAAAIQTSLPVVMITIRQTTEEFAVQQCREC
ncbi:hypothetical protein BDZ89DRAFT_826923 [Hymenopellis radicata]|nr:hypothetical protein BDZ89DRAFT_826923 [Hymenopellis radicata]